jgi:Bacterial Ig domain/Right handed beta helix region
MKTIKNLTILAVAAASLTLLGCGGSENFVFTEPQVPRQPAPQPPIVSAPQAVDDTFTGLGNAILIQSPAGVLSNDTLSEGVISAFDTESSQGATIQLNADGGFTYTPVVGFTGMDTFTYTLENSVGTSTATVTINVPNQGFFVNNQAAPGGDGSQANPFIDLADAITAAADGDIIYLFRGDGTPYPTDPIALPAGVSLIGQGNGLTLAQQIEPAGPAPVIAGTVNLADGNTVRGVEFGDNGDDSIVGNGVTDAVIANNTFNDPDNEGIDLDDIAGTITIDNNTFNGGDYEHIELDNLAGTLVITNNTLAPTTDRSLRIDSVGTSGANLQINGNTWNDDPAVNCGEAVLARLQGLPGATFQVAFNDNIINGSDTTNNAYEDAIDLQTLGAGNVSLTFEAMNNDFQNIDENGIYLRPANQCSATISGNTLTNFGGIPIEYNYSGGSVAGDQEVFITGNTIAQSETGILITTSNNDSPANLTAILTNNQISDLTADGIELRLSSAVSVNSAVAVRMNTITNSGESALDVSTDDNTVCLDITGNTVNDNMVFTETGSGTINVERLLAGQGGPLDDPSVNTFTSGIFDPVGNVISVVAGFCNIP